ncbi:MAG: hypothetical protein ACYDAQ_09580 [Mycobacteriales bacterium]
MIAGVRGFLHFWYDFVIGDDWRIAVGVVAALAGCFLLAHHGVPAWWLLPVAVVSLLAYSLVRATRARK